MKHVITVHGGTSFESYNDYLSYLKKKEVSLEKLRPSKDWKDTLPEELTEEYDVLSPRMPCKENARYEEWSILFEKVLDICESSVILIGHSLGGMFLAKYLSENDINREIEKTILVAAPFDDSKLEESLSEFSPGPLLERLQKNSKEVYLIHSKDDTVVPYSHLGRYRDKLPKAKVTIFDDRGHFNQTAFPELVEIVKR